MVRKTAATETAQASKSQTTRTAKTTKTSSARTSSTRTASARSSHTAATRASKFSRVAVYDVTPHAEAGHFPARVELGEAFRVEAHVVATDAVVGATAYLLNTRGKILMSVPMTSGDSDTSLFSGMLQVGEPTSIKPWQAGYDAIAKQLGSYKVAVKGWTDAYVTWLDSMADVFEDPTMPLTDILERQFEEMAQILTRWSKSRDAKLTAAQKKLLTDAAKTVTDTTLPTAQRLEAVTTDDIKQLHLTNPLREDLTSSDASAIVVERPQSSFAAWYGFFPKSEAAALNSEGQADDKPATLSAAFTGLERAKAEGFSIVHLHTYAPTRSTDYADLKAFCDKAHELDLEVALDVTTDLIIDNDIPSKRLRTVHNALDTNEIIEQLLKAVEAGVTAFRASTTLRGLDSWHAIIEAVTKKHPEVLFAAEQYVDPATQHALGLAGFKQSDSEFHWNYTKDELTSFLTDTYSTKSFIEHRSFWPSTYQVLTDYLRDNGATGYAIRAVLAAMGSPSWGIMAGYERVENEQSAEGQAPAIDESENIIVREWPEQPDAGIAKLIQTLNQVRAEHVSLRSFHNLTILPTNNTFMLALVRHTPAELTGTGKPDTVIVCVNLDTNNAQPANVHIDLPSLGLPTDKPFTVKDELTGQQFEWSWDNYVSLAPWADVAHILSVQY
ncbi:alpha-amylase family protein [Bifidobacterium dolichotidis]|uniref:Alpha-amylase family protein n=1 Tax=Bifidobacterium dolichotidis TaxID=2306976 RepID=A0A430FRI9_9BIFI|nr:maltotransferase domain-containing protein [Bifidobacterium dolichotidis]RSX55480.1 alpha-amylase family protein [Bifidobacterium dolichotidis]